MKKWQKQSILGVLLFALTACTNIVPDSASSQTSQANTPANQTSGERAVVISSTTADNQNYRYILTGGQYQVSATRGATLNLNATVNLEQFEKGLLQLSKTQFPTSQYFFQEGQYIQREQLYAWLARKNEDNPTGLNPPDNGQVGNSSRAPLYLSQILEQDFMLPEGDSYVLGGISIGLALNTVDYYQANNINYTQEIPESEVEAQGKAIAGELLQQLRSIPALSDVPITIGLFKQSSSDDLAGGVYFLKTTVLSGSEIPGWEATNIERVVFPNLGADKDTDDTKSFEAFKNQVQNFFPNLSGVTGVAEYHNGELTRLDIDITTQFYGESEMVAFSEYVTNVATSYLTKNVAISIRIHSAVGAEAVIFKQVDQANFTLFLY